MQAQVLRVDDLKDILYMDYRPNILEYKKCECSIKSIDVENDIARYLRNKILIKLL